MGGGGGNWIRRIVAPWSYKGSEILTSIVDPFNLTGSQDETKAQGYKQPEAPAAEPDPAIAAAAAATVTTEKARQEEMRKRRVRTKTLLSSQDESSATVGKKTLLGG